MKFTEIEIENFLTIGEAKLPLCDLGLVHISGENKDDTSADSNGAGKSSIADAISWVLWGSTARDVSGDDVVNATEGKNCRVSLTIDDNGDIFRVTRYRKHKQGKNALHLFQFDDATQDWRDVTKGTTALTQKAVERIMGTSETVFNSSVYFGQESIPDIPNMTDKQLKLLVEEAAGVDVLTNAYDIARGRYRECSEKRAQAQIDLDRITDKHRDALAFLGRLSDQQKQWEQTHAETVDKLKRETTNVLAELNKAKLEFDDKAAAELRAAITQCENNIAAVNGEREREQLLQSDLTQAQKHYQQAESAFNIAERMAKQAANEVRDAQLNLSSTEKGVGKPCKTCSRPLEAEHLKKAIEASKDTLSLKEDKLRTAAGELTIAKKKLEPLRAISQKCERDLRAYQASMTDVSAEGDKLRNLKRELQLVTATLSEIERLKLRAQNKAEEWKREAALENPFTDSIKTAHEDIKNIAFLMKECDKAIAERREEEEYAEAVVNVFAPNGVRAHRLDEATPFLNERTAHYLGSLADGAIEAYWTTVSETKAKDRLIEKFSVTVEKQGSAPTFKALSGGEKRKVRLSCALALQDLVAARAPKSIDLWLGDEADDALDAAGLERLMSILEEKARERGTVMMISHNDVAHFARKTMKVTKQNGKATVTVV